MTLSLARFLSSSVVSVGKFGGKRLILSCSVDTLSNWLGINLQIKLKHLLSFFFNGIETEQNIEREISRAALVEKLSQNRTGNALLIM